jgi:hypothetical protein
VEQLCLRLQKKVVDNGSKLPKITKPWRDEARRLLDIDGRPLLEALALVDWCQQDAFWRANVLSMTKFREQYDQLRLRAGDVLKPAVTGHDPATAPREWLKDQWRAAAVREIERRTGLAYASPELPSPPPEDVQAWLAQRKQDWIKENHEVILAKLEAQ